MRSSERDDTAEARGHARELIRGSLAALSGKVFGAAAAFGVNVYLGRLLGAELTGLYFLAFAFTTVAATLGRLGLDNAIVRFGAYSAVDGNWVALRGVYRQSMLLTAAAAAVASLLLWVAAPALSGLLFEDTAVGAPLRLMSLAVLPLAITALSAQAFRAIKHTVTSVLMQSAVIPSLMLLCLAAIGGDGQLLRAVLAYDLAVLLAAVGGLWLWAGRADRGRGGPAEFPLPRLLASARPLYLASLMTLAITYFPTFALGAWSAPEQIGLFGAATRTAALQSFVLLAINTIAAPKFAELYHGGDLATLRDTARRATRIGAIGGILPAACLLFGAPWIMGAYGAEFARGAPVLAILVVGEYVNVVTGPVGQILMMTGNEHLVRNVRLSSLLLCVLLSIVLVPRYGSIGAAVTTTLTVTAGNLAHAWLARRLLARTRAPAVDAPPPGDP